MGEVDSGMGGSRMIVRCFTDARDPMRVKHSVLETECNGSLIFPRNAWNGFFVNRVYGLGGIRNPAGIYSRVPRANAIGCKSIRCNRRS